MRDQSERKEKGKGPLGDCGHQRKNGRSTESESTLRASNCGEEAMHSDRCVIPLSINFAFLYKTSTRKRAPRCESSASPTPKSLMVPRHRAA